jgi:hypothetical protein
MKAGTANPLCTGVYALYVQEKERSGRQRWKGGREGDREEADSKTAQRKREESCSGTVEGL